MPSDTGDATGSVEYSKLSFSNYQIVNIVGLRTKRAIGKQSKNDTTGTSKDMAKNLKRVPNYIGINQI